MENASKQRKVDKRRPRTIKAIKTSLMDLLSTKKYEEVTMQDIADNCDIDRRTIYNYYKSLDEVFEDAKKDYIKLLSDAAKTIRINSIIDDPDNLFTDLASYVISKKDEFSNVYNLNMPSGSVIELLDRVSESLLSIWTQNSDIDHKTKNLCSTIIITAMYKITKTWTKSNYEDDLEEMLKKASRMFSEGIKSI